MSLRPFSTYLIAPFALALFAGCSSSDATFLEGAKSSPESDIEADRAALAAVPKVNFKEACPPKRGSARCHSKIVLDENGNEIINAGPTSGLVPDDLRAAYKLPTSGGNGRLVAIVDGFDAPNAEADMNVYRAQFGIPPCTTANGCFKKVNGDGNATPLPPPDSGWATEIAVDLDMVSAMCPDCKILLVEAKTGFAVDLGPAEVTAGRLGAFAINNSYGEPEDDTTSHMVEPNYNIPGVLIVASSGDNGFNKSTEDDGTVVMQQANPANMGSVLSVGGTTLTKSTSARGWAESVWGGCGSGCSSHVPKPSWQKDTGCTKRMIADISAVGDPATGVAYYNGGWRVVGGTSISSPIVTGIFSLFGINQVNWPYDHPQAFFDVLTGKNGNCGSYLCTAGMGYDGPTGLGTPNGALFTSSPPVDAGAKADGAATTGSGGAGGAGTTTTGGGKGGAGGAATTTTTTTGTGGAGGATGAGGSASTTTTTTGAGGDGTTGGSTTGGTATGSGGSTTGAGGGDTTGGTSSGSTTGGTSSTTGSGTTTGQPPVVGPKPDSGGGCGCRVGARESQQPASAAWALFAFGATVVARRTRRRKH